MYSRESAHVLNPRSAIRTAYYAREGTAYAPEGEHLTVKGSQACTLRVASGKEV